MKSFELDRAMFLLNLERSRLLACCPLIAVLTLAIVAPTQAYQIEIIWKQHWAAEKAADVGAQGPSDPHYLTVYDGALYFGAEDGTHGRELWKYDGTTASLVADINPAASGLPWQLTVYDGALYFGAVDEAHGDELWKWDGTTASLAADVRPGPDSSAARNLIVFDGSLYFYGLAAVSGEAGGSPKLWRYDGNTVSAVASLSENWYHVPWYQKVQGVYDGALYISSNYLDPSLCDHELCRFDGVTVSSAADLGPDSDWHQHWMTVYDGKLYFVASNDAYGRELWRYDGISAQMVGDINPGPGGSGPSWLTHYDGLLYLSRNEKLYRGLYPVSVAASLDSPSELTVFDDSLYFFAHSDSIGPDLWRIRATKRTASFYVEMQLPYEEFWKFPIDVTKKVDRYAGTLGLVALAEGAAPRLLARRSLQLNRQLGSDLIYETTSLDPVGLPAVLAFATVVFHDASGRIAGSGVEVLGLEGEPDAALRTRLGRDARALLDSLTLDELNAMEVREFPAHQDENGRQPPAQPSDAPWLLIAMAIGIVLITALVTRTLVARRAAS